MVLESPQNAEEGCVYYEQLCVRDAAYKLGKYCCMYMYIYFILLCKPLVIKIPSLADISFSGLVKSIQENIFNLIFLCIL